MPLSVRFSRIVVATAAALFAAACSDSPSSPTTSSSLDVGAALAEIGRGTPTAVRGEMGASALGAGAPIVPSACSYVAATQNFSCPPVNANGLTITVSYTLLDAAGHSQSTPDAATTAAIRTVSTVKGTTTVSGASSFTGTLTIDRTDDMTLSGLLSGVHTLNGTGAGTSESVLTINGLNVHTSTTDRSTTTNVVLPRSGSGSAWPVSGTIASDQTLVSATGSSPSLTTNIHTVVTFNGSSNITLVVTVGGTTINCTLNLSNPAPSACS